MTKIRVTRFSRRTRYSFLVPNEQTFEHQLIKRIVHPTKNKKWQGQPVQLPLLLPSHF